ncbi:hypothetical protein [Marivita cryptomonadis]
MSLRTSAPAGGEEGAAVWDILSRCWERGGPSGEMGSRLSGEAIAQPC